MAEEQSVGKGRLARGWFSPYGKGLWFSLLLKPTFLPQEAPKMTLLAAVAVVRAVRELCGVKAEIKWPNDILLEGRKLAGILTEMSAEFGHINYLVVGIGINVCVPQSMVPEALRESAVSIDDVAEKPTDRVALLIRSSIIWGLLPRDGPRRHSHSRGIWHPFFHEALGPRPGESSPRTRPIQEKLRTSMKKGPFWCAAKMGMWSGS